VVAASVVPARRVLFQRGMPGSYFAGWDMCIGMSM
jgi:hypothetical protein